MNSEPNDHSGIEYSGTMCIVNSLLNESDNTDDVIEKKIICGVCVDKLMREKGTESVEFAQSIGENVSFDCGVGVECYLCLKARYFVFELMCGQHEGLFEECGDYSEDNEYDDDEYDDYNNRDESINELGNYQMSFQGQYSDDE